MYACALDASCPRHCATRQSTYLAHKLLLLIPSIFKAPGQLTTHYQGWKTHADPPAHPPGTIDPDLPLFSADQERFIRVLIAASTARSAVATTPASSAADPPASLPLPGSVGESDIRPCTTQTVTHIVRKDEGAHAIEQHIRLNN